MAKKQAATVTPKVEIGTRSWVLSVEFSYEDADGTRRGTLRIENADPEITDEAIADEIKRRHGG